MKNLTKEILTVSKGNYYAVLNTLRMNGIEIISSLRLPKKYFVEVEYNHKYGNINKLYLNK